MALINKPAINKQMAPATPSRTAEATVERNSVPGTLSEICLRATARLPLKIVTPNRTLIRLASTTLVAAVPIWEPMDADASMITTMTGSTLLESDLTKVPTEPVMIICLEVLEVMIYALVRMIG